MKTKTGISMKFRTSKPAWAVTVLALLSTVTQTQALDYIATVTNTPNLLGFWQFDPVYQSNSCVNGYTGTLQGNAQIGPPGSGCPLASDPPTQALLLNGTNSYLTTSLTGQISSQGTVLAWVYLTAEPSTAGHIFQVTSQAKTDDDFDLQIQTDNQLYFYTDTGTSTVYPGPLPLNQWQFLAVTFVAGSTRSIYLNGQLVASSTAGAHSVNNTALWIGNNPVFGPRLFQGRLDEVAIFNRALSASEIGAIYAAAQASPTTIDAANHYAYGANIGWVDWRGDTNNGAVIGEYVCSGNLYSADVGWINLGNGAPTNGIYYQNLSGNDFGVNQDGLGNLRGYAYGANIGWLNFESTGAPQVNLRTGVFSGFVWSANCGWISLSNAVAYVQTDTLSPGTLAPNGLPVAWLLTYFTNINVNPNADPTGKGMTIAQDYAAGTDPNDINSVLRITGESFASGGTSASLTWSSVPTRYYYIQESLGLSPASWSDNAAGLLSPSAGSTTTAGFSDTSASDRFYRIQPVQPLVP
jgi:hypothetical protein